MTKDESIMTYDEWEIIKRAGKYYVVDEKGTREVELVMKEPSKYYYDTFLDFGGDYDGLSDDLDYIYSFNLVNWDNYL